MFQFTEEQLAIQEITQKYAQSSIKALADEIDKTGRYPKENIQGLVDIGILQLSIPEEYGGTGMDAEISKARAGVEVAQGRASTAATLDWP